MIIRHFEILFCFQELHIQFKINEHIETRLQILRIHI